MFNKKRLPEKLPKHIGFILDGNGRWAQKRGLPRNFGHKAGVLAIKNVAKALLKYKIPYASMFCFSTENWKRSKEEVDGIFELAKNYLKENIDSLAKSGIKINFLGDLSVFSDDLKALLYDAMEKTKGNKQLNLNICLNYGGRLDIVQAVNKLIKEGKKSITEKDISDKLYTAGQPDMDLLIRTSGELRISNFMIYQLAYSELYFPKTYWPDFSEKELKKALMNFGKRKRRYGGY